MNQDYSQKTTIEELLPRYCEGTTTDEEIAQVEAWLAEEEENKQILQHIMLLNLAADTLHVEQCVDVDKALKKVESKMRRSSVNWWLWMQRVAACLSIPLLLALSWVYMDNNKESLPVVAQIIEVKTQPGMTAKMVLPDSTEVHLNAGSTLRYPSTFLGDSRQVELVGEAFFKVSKDKERRFIVKTLHQSRIEVYGTTFNVEAYDGEDILTTTLLEGSVGFVYPDKSGTMKSVMLKPYQKSVYNNQYEEVVVYNTSCETEMAWKEDKMILRYTPLEDILQMLSKRFNVDFVVKSEQMKKYKFSGTFSLQRLDQILHYLKMSSNINWRYINDTKQQEKQKIEIY